MRHFAGYEMGHSAHRSAEIFAYIDLRECGRLLIVAITVQRRVQIVQVTKNITQRWLVILILLAGILNLLPFMAPVAMKLGWTPVGEGIYTLYSTLCHQMAQRSFFLFGPKPMYELDELPLDLVGNQPSSGDIMKLRLFSGNENLGWKVAWSDRMVYLYGGFWIGAVLYWAFSRRRVVKPVPIWLFVALTVPIAVDGGTHLISDLAGLTGGFRYTNQWLANITGNMFPASFYVGDSLGSFNSWMRLISGMLFGLGAAALALPMVDHEMRKTTQILNGKLLAHFQDSSLSESNSSPQTQMPSNKAF
jgi:uncharacterized membrane protein